MGLRISVVRLASQQADRIASSVKDAILAKRPFPKPRSQNRRSDVLSLAYYDPQGNLTNSMGNYDFPSSISKPFDQSQRELRFVKVAPKFPTGVVVVNYTDRLSGLVPVDLALLTLWPFLTALIFAANYFAVGRSFRPLENLLEQAKTLGIRDRLDSKDTAEFGELADYFNRYLEATEKVMIQQEEFAADAAHEMRTPLTAMKAQLELAILKPGASPDIVNPATAALHQIRRLQRLIDSLLLATRPVDGVLTSTDAVEVVEGAQARWVDRMTAHGVNIETKTDPVETVMPAEELDCVLENVLANAYRFAPKGSRVTIELRPDGDLQIQDEGPGIPDEMKEQVFNRFERGAGEGKGSGIGLYLSRKLLGRYGGVIKFADCPQGARVQIQLPKKVA